MLAEAWASDLDALHPADDLVRSVPAATRPPMPSNGSVPKEVLVVPARDDLVDLGIDTPPAAIVGALVRLYPVTPPRPVEVPPLPTPPGTLVGREVEIAAVLALVRARTTRLVTLTGPGGVGKTRLAVEVARRLVEEDDRNVRFVSLAAVREPARVLAEIARQLDIAEDTARRPRVALRAALSSRATVLLLDNLEQVVGSGSDLAALLAETPDLTILTTSRAPLRVRAEREFPVPPLSLSRGSRVDSDAVRLFVERAWAVNPGFALTEANVADVAEICRRLDGLPLAIELAAARSAVLSPKALLARLDRRLTVLAGGPVNLPDRQRTLSQAIAWSHDLLRPDDRVLFRRLAVFVDGFTIEGAEHVGAEGRWGGGAVNEIVPSVPPSLRPSASVLDGLDRLVAQSLVARVVGDDGPRFRLLETVREFAALALVDAGELDMVADRLLEWGVGLAEQAEPGLIGPEQRVWMERLDVEHDNIRAALAWALDGRREHGSAAAGDHGGRRVVLGLRLAAALWRFWSARGVLHEGQRWLRRAVEQATDAAPEPRAKALNNLGNLANDLGDYPMARQWYEAALALRQEGGDRRGYATTASNLGLLATVQGDYSRAVTLLEESLRIRRELDDSPGIALSLGNLGDAALAIGEVDRAEELHREALVVQQVLDNGGGVAYALHNLAEAARYRGDAAEARRRYGQGIDRFRELGDRLGLGFPLVGLGRVATAEGRPAEAAALLGEALAVRRAVGDRRGVVECLEAIAALASPLGSAAVGVSLVGAATAMREALGAPLPRADGPAHAQLVAALREPLAEARFAAAWAAGQAQAPDAAIADAERIVAQWAADRPVADRDVLACQAVPPPEPATAAPFGASPTLEATALSEREVEVLRLVAEGLTNAEVADRLFVSPRTVHAHLYRIYGKLGVSTRAGATRFALDHGLVRGRAAPATDSRAPKNPGV